MVERAVMPSALGDKVEFDSTKDVHSTLSTVRSTFWWKKSHVSNPVFKVTVFLKSNILGTTLL